MNRDSEFVELMAKAVEQNQHGLAAVAYAVWSLSESMVFAAKEIGKEGASGMGALENLALEIREGLQSIAGSISEK